MDIDDGAATQANTPVETGAPGNLCRVNSLCTAYAGVIGADARPRNAARPARGLTPLETARRRRGLNAAAKRPSLRGDFQSSATFARRSRAVRTYGPRRTPAARKPPCGGTRKRLLRRLHENHLPAIGQYCLAAAGETPLRSCCFWELFCLFLAVTASIAWRTP